jgi:hypothetical protein
MNYIKIKRWGLKIIATSMLCLVFILGITQSNVFGDKKEAAKQDTEFSEGSLLETDPWEEMKKLAERYSGSNLYVSGNLKLYNYETSKFIEEQKFTYSRHGEIIQSRLGDIESITDGHYAVSIDNMDKIILVSNADQNASKLFDIEKLKILMAEDGATAKIFGTSSQRILTVENIHYEDIVNYKIYYDPSTYRISKVVLEMSTELDLLDEVEDKKGSEPDVVQETGQQEIDTTRNDLAMLPMKTDYVLEMNYVAENNHSVQVDPIEKFIVVNNQIISAAYAFKDYEVIDQVKK